MTVQNNDFVLTSNQLVSFRNELDTLHDSYVALQLLVTDSDIEAKRIYSLLHVLNTSFESLLQNTLTRS